MWLLGKAAMAFVTLNSKFASMLVFLSAASMFISNRNGVDVGTCGVRSNKVLILVMKSFGSSDVLNRWKVQGGKVVVLVGWLTSFVFVGISCGVKFHLP